MKYFPRIASDGLVGVEFPASESVGVESRVLMEPSTGCGVLV
jgi:hypothetical protein